MDEDFDEFFETTSEAEKIAVLVIGHSGEVKSTRLQKMSLVVKAMFEGKIPESHGAYLFGGYSDNIDEETETLRSEGYLQYESGKGFSLSADGREVFKFISKKEPELNSVAIRVSEMFKGLSDNQVTAITYKLFPQLTGNSIIKEQMRRIGENIKIETFKVENE